MAAIDWSRWRAEFPSSAHQIHMNHAGLAPLPRRVAETLHSFADQALRLSPGTSAGWERRAEEVRAAFARLIGAQTSEVAFVRNTADGLSLVAAGLPWRSGDNVVALADEYPSNVYPWWGLRRLGVETRMVERPQSRFGADELRPWIDARTRVVAVSAVDWQTGFRADLATLATLCRESGALLVVDGIQAVGAMRVDVRAEGIDCLALGGHKWMLALEGSGALYVSERVVDRIEPVLLGWKSVTDADQYLPYHFNLRPDAGRFEAGSPSHVNILALGAAVDLLLEIGAEHIERRVLEITQLLTDELLRRGAVIAGPWRGRERSAIINFRLGDPGALLAALTRAGVIARERGGGIRLAPHFYNDAQDVARVLAAIDDYARV
jgi:selenocysteine lyase/cysteine desulfurase